MCRICEKEPESHARVLPGRSSLTHSKYVNNKNAAPKVLFFEVLRDVKFADYVHPWYPRMELKPMYESNDVQIDYMAKKVLSMEVSCLWLDDWARKATKKIHEPLWWKPNRQYQTLVSGIGNNVNSDDDDYKYESTYRIQKSL